MNESALPAARILLVEDETRLASFVSRHLAESSFAVEIAEDGPRALELAQATAYDLIILDVMLPGLDGFDVCRELRKRHVVSPILMLSARGVVNDRVRGLDSGADDYLTKPFEFTELSARVRALLRRQKSSATLVLVVSDLTTCVAATLPRGFTGEQSCTPESPRGESVI